MDYTKTASQYIDNGFNVLPLQLDGSKKPIGKWGHLRTRQASSHEIQEWFGAGQCGIGVIAGEVSGNLHVLDFDVEAKELFDKFWADAQRLLPGVIERLLVVATPRPGYQVWFRQESVPPKSQQLALSEPRPTGEVDADGNPVLVPDVLIETRGTGGYACAVGTAEATHPTGRPYQLIHGSFDALAVLTDTEAKTLLDLCQSYTRYTPQHVQKKPSEKYEGEPRPGDVYNQHADIRQLLLDASWKVHHKEDDVEYLTRPGKVVADGYSATLGYIRDDHDHPLLMVFTTAIAPFEKGHCYDAFALYAMIHHKGDYGSAAAQIRIEFAEEVQNAQREFHEQVKDRFEPQLSSQNDDYVPFPLDSLDETTSAYIWEHAAALDIDCAYIAVPLLSVLAGLIGSSRRIQLKSSWTEPSILWTVTVGRPSSGKSPGWEVGIKPAVWVQKKLHVLNEQAREMCGEDKPPPPSQLLCDDITMEALAKIHMHNDRLIIACEELAAWVNSMDQYRGGRGRDSQQWLRLYGGGGISVNRSTNDLHLYLPQSSVSVTGTIQPVVAAETLFSQKARDSGFAYRILAVAPPARVMGWTDAEPPESVIEGMEGICYGLAALRQEACGDGKRPLVLPCSEEAKRAFKRFVGETKEIAEASGEDAESRWVKLRAIAARLALVLAVTKQVMHEVDGIAMHPVDGESMKAGIKLARWFGNEMERNWLTVSGGDSDLLDHFDWICSKHPGGADTRALLAGRHRHGIKTADDARRVFQALIQKGLGKLKDGTFTPA